MPNFPKMSNKIVDLTCLECGQRMRFTIVHSPNALRTDGSIDMPKGFRSEVDCFAQDCQHSPDLLLASIKNQIDNGIDVVSNWAADEPAPVAEENPYIPDTYVDALESASADVEVNEQTTLTPYTAYVNAEPITVFMVGYAKLRSDGNYGHERVEMQANVPVVWKDDRPISADPLAVIEKLRILANAALSGQDHAEVISNDIQHLNRRKLELAADVKGMLKQWGHLKRFLETIGADPKTIVGLFEEDDPALDMVPF